MQKKNMIDKVLIALDLEGVNNVVGTPYSGLVKGCEHWEIARRQAALEVNSAAEALFDAGVGTVALWDNHGGGGNMDPTDLDARIKLIDCDNSRPRMYFADDYDAVFYFGYHAMEGTLGGVLAHTMNSSCNQFYKLNGRYIGEVDMDAYIAASHGIPSCLFVGGDIACRQAQRAVEGIMTVVTKREIARNEAVFRDNAELLEDIGRSVVAAVENPTSVKLHEYPAVFEKSFKRTEDAAIYIKRLLELGICAEYPEDEILGNDAHTVRSEIRNIDEFIKAI